MGTERHKNAGREKVKKNKSNVGGRKKKDKKLTLAEEKKMYVMGCPMRIL